MLAKLTRLKAVSKDWSIAVSSNGNRSRMEMRFISRRFECSTTACCIKPEESDILPDYFQMVNFSVSRNYSSFGRNNRIEHDIRFLRIWILITPASRTNIPTTILSKWVNHSRHQKQHKGSRNSKSLMQNLLTDN